MEKKLRDLSSESVHDNSWGASVLGNMINKDSTRILKGDFKRGKRSVEDTLVSLVCMRM